MKTIVLVRHSNAEDGDYHLNDYDRRLTFKGVQKADKVASACKGFYQPANTVFYTSRAPRAFQTAEMFAKKLNHKRDHLRSTDFLYYCFKPEELLIELEQFNNYETIWVFGHNPMMSELNEFFTGTKSKGFPKCMVSAISFDTENFLEIKEGSGKVVFLVNPKLL